MSQEKFVGGLGCFEVLELLSDYLDGEVSAELKQKIDAHLAGCDECTRFGGEFGAVVKALREQLTKPETTG
jgi:anti-sigma factor RsiW